MSNHDLLGVAIYFGFFAVVGLPVILLKLLVNLPFEVCRKLFHIVITFSIFPLVLAFSNWYISVLTIFLFLLIVYPILVRVERSHLFKRIAVERQSGEFKHSLLVVQLSMALLIILFWGVMGPAWKYFAIIAILTWGFGDAAAALVGKALGRRQIKHPRIQGKKTYEGTMAMYVIAAATMFLSFLIYPGYPWYIGLAIAVLVAPVSATIELFSNGGLDTLTVPISTGVAMLAFIFLITPLVA